MKRIVGSGHALRMSTALMVASDSGGSDTASQTSDLTPSTRKSNTPPACEVRRHEVAIMTQNSTGPAL